MANFKECIDFICEPEGVSDASRSLKRRMRFLNFTMFLAFSLALPAATLAFVKYNYSDSFEDLISAILISLNALCFPVSWKVGKKGRPELACLIFTMIMHITVGVWIYYRESVKSPGLSVAFELLPMVICASALNLRSTLVAYVGTVLSCGLILLVSSLDIDLKIYVFCVVVVISSALTFLVHLRERDDQELAAETKNFLRASQLHAVAENTASIVHEIKNILGVIIGSTRLSNSRLRINGALTSEELESHLKYVDDAAKRMLKIIEGMRKMTRNEGDLLAKDVPFSVLINEAIAMNQQRAHLKSVKIESEIIGTKEFGHLFEVQVIQALTNLLGNAIDAAATTERKWVKVICEANHEWITFIVIDSGPGISNELRKQIFETFFTTKDSGNGIGLSVVRRVADLHKGQLILAPFESGKGAEFQLVIPVAEKFEA